MPGPQQRYSPFDRFMGLDQIDEQQAAPPSGQSSLAGLRQAIESRLGIEPGSPINRQLMRPEEAVQTVQQLPGRIQRAGQSAWQGLAKAAPPPEPTFGELVASGKMQPLSASPYKNQAPSTPSPVASGDDPLRGGKMSFPGGSPNLSSTPGALDNFAALSQQFNIPQVPMEDLYRAKYADPASRAPGSAAWATDQLRGIPGTTEALELELQRQPREIAGITAGGGIRQQELQGEAQRDVANIQGQTARDTSPYGENFLSRMAQLPGNIRSLGKNSVSFGPEQQVSPTLLRDLAATRANFIRDSSDQNKAALDGMIQAVLQQDPANSDIKTDIAVFMSDPTLAGLRNIDDIVEAGMQSGMFDVNPAADPNWAIEKQEYQRLLNLINGGF